MSIPPPHYEQTREASLLLLALLRPPHWSHTQKQDADIEEHVHWIARGYGPSAVEAEPAAQATDHRLSCLFGRLVVDLACEEVKGHAPTEEKSAGECGQEARRRVSEAHGAKLPCQEVQGETGRRGVGLHGRQGGDRAEGPDHEG